MMGRARMRQDTTPCTSKARSFLASAATTAIGQQGPSTRARWSLGILRTRPKTLYRPTSLPPATAVEPTQCANVLANGDLQAGMAGQFFSDATPVRANSEFYPHFIAVSSRNLVIGATDDRESEVCSEHK